MTTSKIPHLPFQQPTSSLHTSILSAVRYLRHGSLRKQLRFLILLQLNRPKTF
jgi:hypothetical protein